MTTYRNWIISHNDSILHPQFDVVAHHRDYDGPEDDRVVSGATLAEVKAEIDEYEAAPGYDLVSLAMVAWGVMVTVVAVASHWFWAVVA